MKPLLLSGVASRCDQCYLPCKPMQERRREEKEGKLGEGKGDIYTFLQRDLESLSPAFEVRSPGPCLLPLASPA